MLVRSLVTLVILTVFVLDAGTHGSGDMSITPANGHIFHMKSHETGDDGRTQITTSASCLVALYWTPAQLRRFILQY